MGRDRDFSALNEAQNALHEYSSVAPRNLHSLWDNYSLEWMNMLLMDPQAVNIISFATVGWIEVKWKNARGRYPPCRHPGRKSSAHFVAPIPIPMSWSSSSSAQKYENLFKRMLNALVRDERNLLECFLSPENVHSLESRKTKRALVDRQTFGIQKRQMKC